MVSIPSGDLILIAGRELGRAQGEGELHHVDLVPEIDQFLAQLGAGDRPLTEQTDP